MIDAYEWMRQERSGPGYRMVCRLGVVGWLRQVAAAAPPSGPTRASCSAHEAPQRPCPGDGDGGRLPAQLAADLCRVLADVAVRHLREE